MKSKYSKTTRQLLDEIRQNQIDETITAVKNKAKKTGMPYSILKKVYDRGMAAWKGGHRPGATQVQWALARVNSFVTKVNNRLEAFWPFPSQNFQFFL